MDKKIKVLHIIHWPKSGIVNLVHNQISASNKIFIDYRVGFLISAYETNDKFKSLDVSVSNYGLKHYNFFRAIKGILNEINEWEPDIVHTHSFLPGLFVRIFLFTGLFTGLLTGCKYRVVSTIHSPYPYFLNKTFKDKVKTTLESTTIAHTDQKVIAVSEYVRKYLLSHSKIRMDKLRVIYPGIYVSGQCDKILEKLSVKKVAVVGRLDKEKRHDRLLNIWRMVINQMPEARLDIIGDGSEKVALQQMAKELCLEESVRFLGHRNDVPELLASANISVLTSDYEGLPLVILESFVQKTPVVAFNIGPLNEIIDRECGVLVDPFDLDLFAESIVSLLKRPDVISKLGENGYRKVIDKFNVKTMVEKIENEYQCIIDPNKQD